MHEFQKFNAHVIAILQFEITLAPTSLTSLSAIKRENI